MAEFFTIAFLGFAFYILFIKGYIWPILGVGLCFAASEYLTNHYPMTKMVVATVMSYQISLAFVIVGIVYILGIGFFLQQNDD